MSALRVNALGPDFAGCAVEAVPVPRPGPGEVLLKVRACALGFPDLLMTEGKYQFKPDLPFTPGGDIAGEVAALGEGVTGFAPGDAVTAFAAIGGMGDYVLARADGLHRIPANLSFEQAAAFGIAYLTAWVALVRRARIEPGQWLLVHGAAGGVGLAAVDLGKHLGAKVIAAAASDDKLAAVRRLYAPDHVINVTGGFREQVKTWTGGGADVVYDPVGGDIFDESARCVAFDGSLLVIGFTSGRIPSIAANYPLIKGFSVVGVRAGEYSRRFPERGRENWQAIWKLAGEGKLTPHVHEAVPLGEWRRAFAMMAGREVVGRVVLVPQPTVDKIP